MDNLEEVLSEMVVVKRTGTKVEFEPLKIALAIKKGFDSIEITEDGEIQKKYSATDIDKIYKGVLKKIAEYKKESTRITIESIQDMIEEELQKKGYDDVFKSFSDYRHRRSASRDMFFDHKRQHKFLKSLEGLGLKSASEEDTKRENANVDGDTAMGTMLQYGSTISKQFALSYLLKKKFKEAHDDGDFHIHDLDFYPMGTTTCTQIDLEKLFTNGFSTGHGSIREPQDIMTYAALAAIAIQANQNDQHGGQSIPAFDYYLAPGVLKTFKKQFKTILVDLLDFSEFTNFVPLAKIKTTIDKLESIEFDILDFNEFFKELDTLERLFKLAYDKALEKTEKITFQAMEGFVHNLNTMHSRAGAQVPFSSINFGTDISPEGRMVVRNFLYATSKGLGNGETPIFPISIFKVKEGVNFNETDPNYDLFDLACQVSAKRMFPNFSFIDATFNKEYYKDGDYKTEVAYMGCRTRVLGNAVDPNKAITPGRGNLSFTSINLPRLAIKHGALLHGEADLDGFFEELTSKMDMIRTQLLDRFEVQCSRRVNNFPFQLGQHNWIDSEKLGATDNLRKSLKHGSLSIGFIGLAEALTALIGKHHGESKEAQELGIKIITFMRNKADEYAEKYNLNFTLLGTPAEGLSGRFVNMDRAIYGKLKGVTDKEYYTNSFHIPVNYKLSFKKKLELEGKYHPLTNAGHITYIEVKGSPSNNIDGFKEIIKLMKDANIGYGAINHPIDRDPICGYTGVINDNCPNCGRDESDSSFERIRRITGYLVGTVDRFNNAKKAEVRDRVKHD